MVEGSHVVCGRAAVGCGMQGVRAPVLLCLRALPGSQGHEGDYIAHRFSSTVSYIKIVNMSIMSTNVYSIRIDDRVRRMMDEMNDVNWQVEIRQSVERIVREKKKQKLLAEAKELWEDQIPNKIGAAEMIREDRDAR